MPAPARWAAVGVLGAAGLLGVARAWLSPAPARLESRPGALAAAAPAESAPGRALRAGGAESASPASAARLININTATAAELDLLPGIGPALAAAIIEDRRANGPFRTLDDLDRVPGIGPKTIAKLVPCAKAE